MNYRTLLKTGLIFSFCLVHPTVATAKTDVACAINANFPGEDISKKMLNRTTKITNVSQSLGEFEKFFKEYSATKDIFQVKSTRLITVSNKKSAQPNSGEFLKFEYKVDSQNKYVVEIHPKIEFNAGLPWLTNAIGTDLLKQPPRDRLRLTLLLKKIKSTSKKGAAVAKLIAVSERTSDEISNNRMLADTYKYMFFRSNEVLPNREILSSILKNPKLKSFWLNNGRNISKTIQYGYKLGSLSNKAPVSFNLSCHVYSDVEKDLRVFKEELNLCTSSGNSFGSLNLDRINWRTDLSEALCRLLCA